MTILSLDVIGAAATGMLILGSSMIDVSDPVVVSAGTIILGALTGAVKVLWDRNNKLSASTDVALLKCEEEHKKTTSNMDALVKEVIVLSEKVGLMTGRIQGFQEATAKASEVADRERDSMRHEMDGKLNAPHLKTT